MPLLKSPLCLLGVLALALGLLQIVPLPPALAQRLSPASHQVYAYGNLPALAASDLPAVRLNEPAAVRSPASLDRAATLHWLVGAAICLGIFWSVTHFADRLGALYLVWGSVVAAFVLNAALGLVQIMGQAHGLYGFLQPGKGAVWAPSTDDLLETPSTAVLRRLPAATAPAADSQTPGLRADLLVGEVPFLFGTMMGGAGAFLALGSLALPLALAIVLHVTPAAAAKACLTGSSTRAKGAWPSCSWSCSSAGTFLVGLMAGPWFCLPFVIGLAVVGLPARAARAGLDRPHPLLVACIWGGCGARGLLAGGAGGRPPVAPPRGTSPG